MFCPNCGNRYGNEKFCSKCGTKLPAQGQSAQAGPQGQAVPPTGQGAGSSASYTQQQTASRGTYTKQNAQRPAGGYQAPSGNNANYGQPRPQQPPVYRPQAPMGNPVGRKFREICSQTSFLVMAILFSAAWIIGLFLVDFDNGVLTIGSINILLLLGVIGLWVTYASAKSSAAPFSSGGIKLISGTILAMRILVWVLVGLLAVFIIVCLVSTGVAVDLFGDYFSYYYAFSYGAVVRGGMAIIVIILLVVMALLIVFNLTCYTYFNHFTRSCYQSAEQGRANFARVHATKCWLIALGVLAALSAIAAIWGSFVAFFSSACQAAGYFAAYVWINKNFSVVPAPVGVPYQPQGGYRQTPPQYNGYQQTAPQYGYQPPRPSAPQQNMGYQPMQQNTPQQNGEYQPIRPSAPQGNYQAPQQSAQPQYSGYQQPQQEPEKPADEAAAENQVSGTEEGENKE